MAELLAYLEIGTKKEYHEWCRHHHPDRNPEPSATRRFQIVSRAWSQAHAASSDPEPKLTEDDSYALFRKHRCTARVAGTVNGVCWRKAVADTAHCYYHQPGTAHMAFVDDRPDFFFGINHTPLLRSDKTCRARLDNGKLCTGWSGVGKLYCFHCEHRKPGRRRCNSI